MITLTSTGHPKKKRNTIFIILSWILNFLNQTEQNQCMILLQFRHALHATQLDEIKNSVDCQQKIPI